MKSFKAILYATAIIPPFLTGCTRNAEYTEHKPIISVSIEPLRKIVEDIAGEDYEVVTVLDRGANPETFEPSMSRRISVDKSDAYMAINVFPFETTISKSAKQEVAIFDISDGIEPIYGTHSHQSNHNFHNHDETPDPHLWTSLKNAKIIAANVTRALSSLNPDRVEIYSIRLDSISNRLDSIDTAISTKLSDIDTRAFAIWHPSLSYLARDYNLHQISVGQESKEISPRKLREIIEHATADNVQVFFFQKEFDSRQASTINERLGTRMITIDPLAYDWDNQIITITDELSRK